MVERVSSEEYPDHLPVMLNEVLSVFEDAANMPKSLIDGTFGAGGYTRAFLDRKHRVLAIDRDPNAIRDGQKLVQERQGQLVLVRSTFSELDKVAMLTGFEAVDGVVLDIGVSSMQLDQAERGFSFRQDGPLDMRMSQSGPSAADVVNTIQQSDLTRVIGLLGEERNASRISRAIVSEREKSQFSSTLQLANLIERTVGRKPGDRIHPATRTFQAIRIFVNQELEELGKGLFAAERILKEGGRLVVITFHSLEDRMVKLFFKNKGGGQQGSRHLPILNQNHATFAVEGKGLIKASNEEADANPRARSAKMRWGVRTGQDFQDGDMSIFGLPSLTSIASFQDSGSTHS